MCLRDAFMHGIHGQPSSWLLILGLLPSHCLKDLHIYCQQSVKHKDVPYIQAFIYLCSHTLFSWPAFSVRVTVLNLPGQTHFMSPWSNSHPECYDVNSALGALLFSLIQGYVISDRYTLIVTCICRLWLLQPLLPYFTLPAFLGRDSKAVIALVSIPIFTQGMLVPLSWELECL